MGTVPGGWINVLADANMQVVTVDPNELDEMVRNHPNVRYVLLVDITLSPR
jgi:23S rRNA C2498 (ribose-2'-O)-methylase RlmM